jgi:hypothetical protein
MPEEKPAGVNLRASDHLHWKRRKLARDDHFMAGLPA